jgi:hypothetical protein
MAKKLSQTVKGYEGTVCCEPDILMKIRWFGLVPSTRSI